MRYILKVLLHIWFAVTTCSFLYLVIGTHTGNGVVGWPF